jgi:hypothetical protein
MPRCVGEKTKDRFGNDDKRHNDGENPRRITLVTGNLSESTTKTTTKRAFRWPVTKAIGLDLLSLDSLSSEQEEEPKSNKRREIKSLQTHTPEQSALIFKRADKCDDERYDPRFVRCHLGDGEDGERYRFLPQVDGQD